MALLAPFVPMCHLRQSGFLRWKKFPLSLLSTSAYIRALLDGILHDGKFLLSE